MLFNFSSICCIVIAIVFKDVCLLSEFTSPFSFVLAVTFLHGLVSLLTVVVFMGVVDDDSDEVSFFLCFWPISDGSRSGWWICLIS